MNVIEAALEAVYEALANISGVRLYRGVGVQIDPPATAVGPPRLQRELMGSDPTTATFQVAVIVAQTEDAMVELLRLEPLVAAALDQLSNVSVGDSNPGTWPAGGVDLPAYLIDVDVAL